MKKNFGKLRLAVQISAGALLVAGGLENLPVTLLIILVSTLFAGPIFCGWICPFGTLQDVVSKLTYKIKKRKMTKGLQKGLAISRYVLFGVTSVLTADFVFTLMQYDARINLMSALGGNLLTFGAYAVLVAYLVIAVFFERPFCSYMCPEGAKYGLIGSLRPFRIVRNADTCVNCGKCDKACPMSIDITGGTNVTSLQCINCMQCVAACPKRGAIKFGILKLSRKSMAAYFAVVVLLVAGGTGALAYRMTVEEEAVNVAEQQAVSELQTEVAAQTNTAASTSTNIMTTPAPTAATQPTTPNTQQSTAVAKPATQSAPQSTPATQPKTQSTQQSTVAVQPTTQSIQPSTTATQPAAQTQTNTTVPTGDAAGIADGTYNGQANGFRGPMTVAVTVQNQQIVNIEVVDNVDDRKWFNRAIRVIDDMLAAQSTNVDTVTGATYSSLGIINAAKDALNNAQ